MTNIARTLFRGTAIVAAAAAVGALAGGASTRAILGATVGGLFCVVAELAVDRGWLARNAPATSDPLPELPKDAS